MITPIHYLDYSPHPIVGVDEVGRGCLAGPVVASAVCLQSNLYQSEMTDSKLLSEKRREELAPLLCQAHWFGLGSASVEEIDELNILQASLLAMKRAVENLEEKMGQKSGHILVDGNMKIPDLSRKQTTIIKGDLRVLPISAASIIAKAHRDGLMRTYAQEYPQYGFEKHKGYGSESHRKAIENWGPTDIHRASFKGVKEYIGQRTSG